MPMLLVPTELRASQIHGVGVFLLAPVQKGGVVWRFSSRIDRVYTEDEFNTLPALLQDFIKTYACWHEGLRLYKLSGDNLRHCNHSDTTNLVTAGGPFGDGVARFDLESGTELTEDYRLVCDHTRLTGKL
jgi:hypothetical protein